MPNSVVIGRLRTVERDAVVIGGGLRLILSPGVTVPNVPVGTSLTIIAVHRDGVTYAENVERTPDGGLFTGAY
jgi:hypothetical protein